MDHAPGGGRMQPQNPKKWITVLAKRRITPFHGWAAIIAAKQTESVVLFFGFRLSAFFWTFWRPTLADDIGVQNIQPCCDFQTSFDTT